jgi:hypothetical protein
MFPCLRPMQLSVALGIMCERWILCGLPSLVLGLGHWPGSSEPTGQGRFLRAFDLPHKPGVDSQ